MSSPHHVSIRDISDFSHTELDKNYRFLTHWGRDKMAAIFQTTFWNGFSWLKMHEFRLTFHWSLFLGVQLTIFSHWFRKWLGTDQATSHYLNQWWLDYRRIYASLSLNELTRHVIAMYFSSLKHTGLYFELRCSIFVQLPDSWITSWILYTTSRLKEFPCLQCKHLLIAHTFDM